jgi:hypothetical protein
MISEDTGSVTFLRDLECGRGLFDAVDGRTSEISGPQAVLARHSRRPGSKSPAPRAVAEVLCRMLDELATSYASTAEKNGLPTGGTYTRSCGDSSPSAVLTYSLESRFRRLTGGLGSRLFVLRWKYWGTPLGPRISALRASAAGTSGRDCTSWPTPDATNLSDGVDFDTQMLAMTERRKRAKEQKLTGSGRSMTLQMAAQSATWPTPCRQDGPNGGPNQGTDRLPGAADLANWQTPNANDSTGGKVPPSKEDRSTPSLLKQQVMMAHWTSPNANEATETPETKDARNVRHREAGNSKGVGSYKLGTQVQTIDHSTHQTPNGSTAGTESIDPSPWSLNPSFSRCLMRLPAIWDMCAFRAHQVIKERSSGRSSKKVKPE